MSARIDRIKERRRSYVGLLLLFLAAAGCALFLRFGCQLTNLDILNCTYYEEDAMRSWLCDGVWENQTWFLYLKLRFGEVPSIPFIEQVEVDFVDLHTLRIGVYEKEVIGCLPYMGEYVCFDKDGVMVGSVIEKREDIPLVTGIEYERIVYNEKMDTPQSDFFRIVLNITQLIQKYELPIEQVDFDRNREVTLYAGNVRILLGNQEQYDEPLSALPDILKKSKGFSGTLQMQKYSEKNQDVVFVEDEK